MKLTDLRLRDFRNIAEADFSLPARVTVLHGENGQGKTNCLEAIWALATQRPLRGSRMADLVRLDAPRTEVRGTVVEDITSHLLLGIEGSETGGRKRATVDGKRPASIAAYADTLKVVAFTPDDLMIAKGSPGERRRWLDRGCFTRWTQYLADHRVYTHALKSRNRLLKDARRTGRLPDELPAFDAALATAGAQVLGFRRAFLNELGEGLGALYRSVTGTHLALGAVYETKVHGDNLEDAFLHALERTRIVDLARGFTTVGPHADDVALTLDGKDVRAFASQGQQRATVLALKIAEIETLLQKTGRVPVLLLDDVASELDPERNAHLLTYLSSFSGQVILTTTDPSLAPVPPDADTLWLVVQDGVIRSR